MYIYILYYLNARTFYTITPHPLPYHPCIIQAFDYQTSFIWFYRNRILHAVRGPPLQRRAESCVLLDCRSNGKYTNYVKAHADLCSLSDPFSLMLTRAP